MQAHRLLDGVRLLHAVDHDKRSGSLGHVRDASKIRLELVELAAQDRRLLLVLGKLSAVGLCGGLQLAHALHGRPKGLGVGKRSAEPAFGHVELPGVLRDALHEFGDLLLGRHEKQLLTCEDNALHERRRLIEQFNGLLQVDDVDSAALVEDVPLHLRVPALGLVAEVQSGVKHILEGYAREGRCRHIHFFLLYVVNFSSIRFGRDGRPRSFASTRPPWTNWREVYQKRLAIASGTGF